MGLVAKQMSTGDRTILGRISKRGNGRTARALHIWRDARLGAGTIVARYLESRGIVFDRWPPSLRFHSRSPRPRDDEGGLLPPLQAMVAEHVERGPVAVHCTYLTPDGSAKARLPKEKHGAHYSSSPRQGYAAPETKAAAARARQLIEDADALGDEAWAVLAVRVTNMRPRAAPSRTCRARGGRR